jgi:drug/metabolite transporter (DMT)-like permease
MKSIGFFILLTALGVSLWIGMSYLIEEAVKVVSDVPFLVCWIAFLAPLAIFGIILRTRNRGHLRRGKY